MIPGQLWRVHTEANQKPPFGAQLNWASEANKGLVLDLPFNEGAGGQAWSGTGAVGLAQNCAWTPSGLRFDASNDSVVPLSNVGALASITDDITMEAWINPVSVAARQTIIGRNNATRAPQLEISYSVPGSIGIMYSGMWIAVSSTSPVRAGQTNQLVGIRSTVTGTPINALYCDGVAQPLTTTSVSGFYASPSWELGRRAVAAQEFTGVMGLIRVYSRALTADEIAADYAEPWGQGRYLVPTFTRIFDMGAGTTPYIPSPLILGTQVLGAI